MIGLLSGLLILPLLGAAALFAIPGDSEEAKTNVRWITLATTLLVFLVSIVAWFRFNPSSPDFQLVEQDRKSVV